MKVLKLFFTYFILLFSLSSFSFSYETKESAVKSFITTLYENILGREPDSEGIEYWEEALYSNSQTATEVTRYFFTSNELKRQNLSDEEFIRRVYLTLLNREPDKEGYEYWLSLLKEKKIPRLQLFYRFVFSDEFEKLTLNHGVMPYNKKDLSIAFLERLYNLILQRDSDGYGLDYWYEKLVTKEKSPKVIAKDFFYSEEFLKRDLSDEEFVEIAYRTLLNREPEDEGFWYWVERLKNGYERDRLLDDFLSSKEFKNITEKFLNKNVPVLKDIYPPSFYAPKFLKIDDNASEIFRLDARDDTPPVKFFLKGDDGEFFEIRDGVLYEKEPLFFRHPKDKNGDNVYEIVIEAKDGRGNSIERETKIKVCSKKVSQTACEAGLYQVGSFNWGSKNYAVCESGGYAYLINRYEGVYVIDVKNPASPSFVGLLKMDDLLLDAAFYKGYLFVAGGKNGIKIVNVTDPKNPKIEGVVDKERVGIELFVYKNFLFSVNYGEGVDIYDLKDPLNPSLVTHIESDTLLGRVFVKEDKLYIAAEEEGLLVYDIKDIYNPSLLGSLYFGENAKDVTVSGGFAYVALLDEGIKKVDLDGLKVVDSLKLDSKAVRILARDGYLFVADGSAGIKVIDIDGGKFKLVGFLEGSEVNDLFIDGEFLYAADGKEGLKIVDISNPVTKGVLSFVDLDKGAYKLLLDEDRAFVADFNKNLRVIDIKSPLSPSLLSTLSVKHGNERGVEIGEDDVSLLSSVFKEDDYITDMKKWNEYLLMGNGVYGVKVLDIENLNEVYEANLKSSVSSVAVKDKVLYLGTSDKRVEIYKLSLDGKLEKISSYALKFSPEILAVNGDLLFAASVDGGLEILDVSESERPVFKAFFNLEGNIFDLLFYKGYLFVAAGSRGVSVYDIGDGSEMRPLFEISLKGYARNLSADGERLFVGSLYKGIFSFDIEDMKRVKEISFFPLYGVMDVKERNGVLYAVDFNRGFWMIDRKTIEKNYYLTRKRIK